MADSYAHDETTWINVDELGTRMGMADASQRFETARLDGWAAPVTDHGGECSLHWPDGDETVCGSCRQPLADAPSPGADDEQVERVARALEPFLPDLPTHVREHRARRAARAALAAARGEGQP